MLASDSMKLLWSTLRQLLPLLPSGARAFFLIYIVITSALTLLDVGAMALLMLVITPIVAGAPINIPIIGSFPVSAAPWLILVACVLIIAKGALSLFFHWVARSRESGTVADRAAKRVAAREGREFRRPREPVPGVDADVDEVIAAKVLQAHPTATPEEIAEAVNPTQVQSPPGGEAPA